jgi:ATP/maltotriose-dependent transcriptional regulator MalT
VLVTHFMEETARLCDRVAVVDAGQVVAIDTPEALSERELAVLRLIAAGASNREAVAQLVISESTVKTHLLHICDKLDVRDRAAAVSEAYKRRLLT